ncbi:hypothetical protein [uncultured Alistipes sp.]|uniref:hypothetical protein n=1 Tax=uncultured Alistipes sp. TaxID=538949 RepID=UPI00262B3FDD|nr:hypothetical protein [uncultured Alistipes sp.]
MKRLTCIFAATLLTLLTASAGTIGEVRAETDTLTSAVETPRSRRTKQRFLPTRQRMDREINKIKFAYRGEVMLGMTASYGTLTTDDADMWTLVSNLSADGAVASIRPFVGYFYKDNRCLGARFGYQYMNGKLQNGAYDLGESNDVSGDIPYMDFTSNSYSFGIFHRSYAGLDNRGRFGLFAEFEFQITNGSSDFVFDDLQKRTFCNNTQIKLAFNPGAAIYIFPNVCGTISFGLGGIQYNTVTQKDASGETVGTRKTSKMRFRLNLLDINFGMTVHLWDKKKK